MEFLWRLLECVERVEDRGRTISPALFVKELGRATALNAGFATDECSENVRRVMVRVKFLILVVAEAPALRREFVRLAKGRELGLFLARCAKGLGRTTGSNVVFAMEGASRNVRVVMEPDNGEHRITRSGSFSKSTIETPSFLRLQRRRPRARGRCLWCRHRACSLHAKWGFR